MGDVVKFRPPKEKRIYFIIIALLSLATLVLIYLNVAHSAYNKQISLSGTTIMSVDSSVYIFKKAGEEVVVCGPEGISAINKKGEIAWHTDYGAASPFMATSGDYVLCADLNSSDCKVLSKGREVSSQKLPYEIITATVNVNGYYAVASKERGYKSQIAVYDKNGTKVFGWHSTKYHVVALALDDSNKNMLVSVVDVAEKPDNAFKMLHFSFNRDMPAELECTSGNLVSSISFSDGKFFAAGDTSFYAYNAGGSKAFNIDYNGRTLQKFSVLGSTIALGLTKSSVEGYYGGSVVEIYSSQGTKRGYAEIDDEISFLDIEENKILVNSPDGAYILNDAGRIHGDIAFADEVREGIIFSGGKKLLLVNGLNVNVYDAK